MGWTGKNSGKCIKHSSSYFNAAECMNDIQQQVFCRYSLSDYASNALLLLLERLIASASAVSTLSNLHFMQESAFIFARLSWSQWSTYVKLYPHSVYLTVVTCNLLNQTFQQVSFKCKDVHINVNSILFKDPERSKPPPHSATNNTVIYTAT